MYVHTSKLIRCARDTKLVAPCGCTGSAEFTHKKCLEKWTNVKGASTCEICNQGYKPKYNMTTLSKPTPHPPCGNAPYLNDRM